MKQRHYRIGPLWVFSLNVILVWVYLCIVLHEDAEMLRTATFMATLIVAVQTPILVRARDIGSRLLVLYGSMLLFLFCFGVAIGWDSTVGSHQAGSWMARLDGGLRVAIFGQIFAFPGFILIALANMLTLARSSG